MIEPYELAAIATRHIEAGQQRVRKQLELFVNLEAGGHNQAANAARGLLDTMQMSMAILRGLRENFTAKYVGALVADDEKKRGSIASARDAAPSGRIRRRARSRRRKAVFFRPATR